MPDLTTVSMMIVLSSAVLALLTFFLGRPYWQSGSRQIALSLMLFGLSYGLLSYVAIPHRQFFLVIGYVLFSCAFCASTAALHRFYRIPLPAWPHVAIPLVIAAVCIVLRDQPETRARTINGMLALQNLWILLLPFRHRRLEINRGELIHSWGVALVTSGLLLRVFQPNTSLSLLHLNSDAAVILIPYAFFYIALHLKAIGFLMMAHAQASQQLHRFAHEDSLTGLANRRSLMQALQVAQTNAQQQRHALTLLMIDIDHFKRINDQCGHPMGDKILAGLGQILLHKVRPKYVAGRYGGEEFVVICPDTNSEEGQQLAGRLCAEVRDNLRAEKSDGSWPVTISIGISVSPADSIDIHAESMLQQADQALYAAKQAGRDQYCLYGAPPRLDNETDSMFGSFRFPERFVRQGLDCS